MSAQGRPRPTGVSAYSPQRPRQPIDLRLDANEGRAPSELARWLSGQELTETLRRYPSAAALEERLAARLRLGPRQVLVTAGADDAIERILRAYAAPGREVVAPLPTFTMIERYVSLCGATLRPVPWLEGGWPLEAVLERVGPRTAVITVVTPNNPTGLTASAEDLRRLSAATPGAVLLVDLAYAEYAGEDLTRAALELPNAVVCRTFSKARGLAGLRVGIAAGPERLIEPLRAVGHPYPCSSLSLALAERSLEPASEREMQAHTARVRIERRELSGELTALGCEVTPSEANFLLVRPPGEDGAAWLWDALAGLGIAVRRFRAPELCDALRITLPGEIDAFERLRAACRAALRPEALLLDVDDTLVDTSASFRGAIIEAAARFGVTLSTEEVCGAKASGGANDDWVLTGEMLAARGVRPEFSELRSTCERIYRGTQDEPGLAARERLLVDAGWIRSLARCLPLALVTGRERRDAESVVERWSLGDAVSVIVSADDAPSKPSPAPVRRALDELGVRSAWMVGDSPQDVRAARAAGVVPIGVVAPGERRDRAEAALLTAGAARVLDSLEQVERLLP